MPFSVSILAPRAIKEKATILHTEQGRSYSWSKKVKNNVTSVGNSVTVSHG